MKQISILCAPFLNTLIIDHHYNIPRQQEEQAECGDTKQDQSRHCVRVLLVAELPQILDSVHGQNPQHHSMQ
jgi:hypothetical protein